MGLWSFSFQLANAHDQIVVPLEHFRQKHIGGVKEKKKSFYKKTAKYCQAQERFLAMSSKRPDNVVIEVSVEGRVHSVMDGNAAIFNDWDSFQFNLITRLDLLSHSQCIWRIIGKAKGGFPCPATGNINDSFVFA